MKVKQKPTWLLEDCFDAEERGTHVRISRHRSKVIVEVSLNGVWFEREWTLAQFAARLAAGVDGPWAEPEPRAQGRFPAANAAAVRPQEIFQGRTDAPGGSHQQAG